MVFLGRLVGMVGMGDETRISSPVLYQECSSYELFDRKSQKGMQWHVIYPFLEGLPQHVYPRDGGLRGRLHPGIGRRNNDAALRGPGRQRAELRDTVHDGAAAPGLCRDQQIADGAEGDAVDQFFFLGRSFLALRDLGWWGHLFFWNP